MAIGRPQKFDKDDLLDKSVDLIWREGPTALSLNEIANRLGVAKPGLASRFGSKDDFLVAVLKHYHERLDGMVQTAIAEADTVEAIARAYLGSYVTVLSSKPIGPETGCLLAATTEAFATKSDNIIADTARVLNASTRAGLVQALHRADAADPENLARYLYGQSVALAFLSRCGASSNELEDFVERALSVI
ncbi:TetR/AcrR family transcriptional regulator [uncultured Roseobacter sp.]|uniref:TetR/AcrR family transcriptional regulator n=1 Tax=uncultured Roseobacter sp. TaxID=114847 RepID=UPI002635E87C|nr:TetR/AcrR family transcriptional regulator [uncultured Roseobacter sp.]